MTHDYKPKLEVSSGAIGATFASAKKDHHQLPKDHKLVVLNLLLSASNATIAGPEKRTLPKGKRHIFDFNKKKTSTH